jgi:hypothetical protein
MNSIYTSAVEQGHSGPVHDFETTHNEGRHPSLGPDAHRSIQLVQGLVIQSHALSKFECQVMVFLRPPRDG